MYFISKMYESRQWNDGKSLLHDRYNIFIFLENEFRKCSFLLMCESVLWPPTGLYKRYQVSRREGVIAGKSHKSKVTFYSEKTFQVILCQVVQRTPCFAREQFSFCDLTKNLKSSDRRRSLNLFFFDKYMYTISFSLKMAGMSLYFAFGNVQETIVCHNFYINC